MFDIGVGELLVILIVAVVVIGPKDLPLAMRTAGRWIGRMRRLSAHFRSGIDAMVREAELEDMEKKWKAQNEEIMRRSATLTTQADGAEAGAPVMAGPPPGEPAPLPYGPPPPPVAPPPAPAPPNLAKPAIIKIGGAAPDIDADAPRPTMLPARPMTGDEDV